MPETRFLTLSDIAHIMKIGESTLNVWLNRYKEWLPSAVDNELRYFPASILDQFRFIFKCTHAGMEHHEIQCVLDARNKTFTPPSRQESDSRQSSQAPRTDPDMLSALKDMMSGIVEQQKRIADAQERRALAEERKAYALESRTENEMIKVGMLREIVSALQDMTLKSSVSSLMDRVKDGQNFQFDEIEAYTSGNLSLEADTIEDIPELIVDEEEPVPEEMDNLEELYPDDPVLQPAAASDGNEDLFPDTYNIEDTVAHEPVSEVEIPQPEMESRFSDLGIDDLSSLLDPGDIPSKRTIDDLSMLLEPDDLSTGRNIDDLSALLEPGDRAAGTVIDDLSALLEPEDRMPARDIDDLSALLEPGDRTTSQNIDDLSALLEPEDLSTGKDVDNLSALLDDDPTPPIPGPMAESKPKHEPPKPEPAPEKPKPTQKPEEDHKSKILKRIIQMKQKQGLSVEETTQIFNEEGVKTLSGKPSWDTKTIQGIYKYIDSVSK